MREIFVHGVRAILEREVDQHVDVLVYYRIVEVGHHACHAETVAVCGLNVTAYNVGRTEITHGETLRDYDVVFFLKACCAVAAQQREVEHVEKRRVGHQRVRGYKEILLFQLYFSCRNAARPYNFRILFPYVPQHSVRTIRHWLASSC